MNIVRLFLLAAVAFAIMGFPLTRIVTASDTDCLLNRPLARASMNGCDLRKADLTFANLRQIDLRNARLGDADLRFAILVGAKINDADLIKADLSFTNLVNADLSNADLMGANLTGANLFGTNLSGANLSGANLMNADLSGANLTGADLQLATLFNANLSNANLGQANLAGVNLGEANVNGASFQGATFAGGYRRSGIRNADLDGAIGLDTVKGTQETEVYPAASAKSATSVVAQSSMDRPWPAGTAVKVVGNWELTIVSVIRDATKSVLAFNPLANKVPEDGYQYVQVGLRFTNVGTEPNAFQPDFRLRLIGSSMVPYDQFYSCGVIPRNVATGGWNLLSTRAYPGGTIEGNLCWKVKSSEVASLILIDEGVRQNLNLPPAQYFSLPD